MKSMTGYGKAERSLDAIRIEAEIRCVNGRGLKLASKVPPEFGRYETEIKRVVAGRILRGSVNVTIALENQSSAAGALNESLLLHYHSKLGAWSRQLGLPAPSWSDLLSIPGIFDPGIPGELDENTWAEVARVLEAALEEADRMRASEGAELEAEILSYLAEIERDIALVERRVPEVLAGFHERLKNRLQEFAARENFAYTREDILREAAIFTEKADFSEETARMRSHICQFREITRQGQAVGRTIEFLLQEMQRESNTIASKANDSECSKLVVQLKSNIEKIKEQIQNVE